MNDALTNRLVYLRTALFAMLGYVLLEWLRTALWANTTTVWLFTGLLSLGGLTWIVVDLTSVRRGHALHRVAPQPRAAEIRSRGGDWRFDETDTSQFLVGDDVLPFVPAVRPVLERALLDIQDDPLANPREVVGGEIVYVKRLRPAAENVTIPALLLAFKATQRDRKIRRLALDRTADETTSPSAQETYAALERVMATATRRAKG